MPGPSPTPIASAFRRLSAAPIVGSLGLLACAGEPDSSLPPTTGPELLDAAIAYHDPADRWPGFRHTLVIDQSRPDGSERRATIHLDASSSDYTYEEATDAGHLVKGTDGEECFATVAGEPPTTEQAESLRLDCSGIQRMRDYYLYLWGLPMKLRDPGTNIDPAIQDAEFDGRTAVALRVTYDPAVLGMKIPVERRWFTNTGDRYLGTDVLMDAYAGGPAG